MNTQQLIDKLQRVAAGGGGWILWLMLALSVVSIAIMAERALFFFSHRDDVDGIMVKVLHALRAGDLAAAKKVLSKSRAIEADVIGRSIDWFDCGAEAFSEATDAEMERTKRDLEKGTNFLGTLGNNAPFIGLLGTVLGVIQAFQQLGNTGNKDAMANVMVGIAEALIATGVGLFVAIPAVVGFNVISKQISNVESAVGVMRKKLVAQLKAREHGAFEETTTTPEAPAVVGEAISA